MFDICDWDFFLQLCNITYSFDIPTCINDIRDIIFESHEQEWFAKINEPNGLGEGGNKLRTYCTFKYNFSPEPYVTCIMSKKHRSDMEKIRCGVAHIKLETGRYNGTPVNDRICEFCNVGDVEDEFHVVMDCFNYNELRHNLFYVICLINDNFNEMSKIEQFKFILSNESCIQVSARYLSDILDKRMCAVSRQ